MPQVTVTINGRRYSVACDAGQEQRIGELARYVEGKVEAFVRQFPQAGEGRLLVLAALVIADELAEAGDALRRMDGSSGDGTALAAGIDALAARIETVAARLEAPQL